MRRIRGWLQHETMWNFKDKVIGVFKELGIQHAKPYYIRSKKGYPEQWMGLYVEWKRQELPIRDFVIKKFGLEIYA